MGLAFIDEPPAALEVPAGYGGNAAVPGVPDGLPVLPSDVGSTQNAPAQYRFIHRLGSESNSFGQREQGRMVALRPHGCFRIRIGRSRVGCLRRSGEEGQNPERNGSKPNHETKHGCFMRTRIANPEPPIMNPLLGAFAAVLVFGARRLCGGRRSLHPPSEGNLPSHRQ